ncbi:adenylyltransferase and sulfurtransferase MOCS3 [Cephus cinctus]|uniref:Adenylyltransferase and sulfurtransferase MOCS3 homolog n=1 Tax=Cephus cinctus TaxID=211228 RepID=A0AAJ7W3X9_CEPCN|nr:adenylyltransferase and sulfurtransferase MOCS3 [Cephus cinctus]
MEKELVKEIAELRKLLHEKENKLAALRREKEILQSYGLSNNEVCKYSRQILIPEINIKGQVKIKNSSVLIVGAGGLGCPSALYLAGAGVGCIGIVDYDDVEVNNLHRQLLFTEDNIGTPKVDAAAEFITRLNRNVKIIPYKLQLSSSNALQVIENYDIVLDCTDNVATRYLLNDACVLSGKPLVSGSALKFEGQLTVYNYKGPCYRCIFPTPPAPYTVTNCGDGGVVGAAVGTIGLLQALEALKIILEMPGVLTRRLLLFDGTETTFRNIKLRPKNLNCAICGNNRTIHKLIDYEQFCGAKANDKNPDLKILRDDERVTVEDYHKMYNSQLTPHILIDVRSPEEFEICQIKNSINVPFTEIEKDGCLALIEAEVNKRQQEDDIVEVFVLCRRGNDSQNAVKRLQKYFDNPNVKIRDIEGGIHAWSRKFDPLFPIY